MLAAYAFWLYAFGPAVSLLRTQLHFSYAVVGAYSAAWSLGAIFAGLGYARLAAALPRRGQLWSLVLATSIAAGVFALATSVVATLLASLAIGTAGTALQMTTQSMLSERHRAQRGEALMRANVGAGAVAVLAPLALGGLASTALGWRVALALPAVALVGLYLQLGSEPLREGAGSAPEHARGGVRSLSSACVVLCVLVAVGIGVEFCVVYFGAELLEYADGLAPATAAGALTAFYAGILAGRLLGVRFGAIHSEAKLLAGSVTIALAGLMLTWLARSAVLSIAGLAIAGIGVANLFPLSVALALDAAGDFVEVANGFSQLLGGVVVLVAPFALGVLANAAGLDLAFAIAPLLSLACGGLLLAAVRMRRSEP